MASTSKENVHDQKLFHHTPKGFRDQMELEDKVDIGKEALDLVDDGFVFGVKAWGFMEEEGDKNAKKASGFGSQWLTTCCYAIAMLNGVVPLATVEAGLVLLLIKFAKGEENGGPSRKAPSPTPGPARETSPAPAPDVSAPTTDASSPTPMMSPPAPPTLSPTGDPKDSPAADSENSTAGKKKNDVFGSCAVDSKEWFYSLATCGRPMNGTITNPLILVDPIRDETKDYIIIDAEDYKATGYSHIPMFVQHTEAMMKEIDRMYEEISVPVVEDLILIPNKAYIRKKVLEMVELVSFFLIELCLVEYEMLIFPTSILAVATVFNAQCTLSVSKEWNITCEKHSSYDKNQILPMRLSRSDLQKVDADAAIADFNKLERKAIGTALFLDCVGSKPDIVSTMILCYFCKSKSKKLSLTN
ncbi:putative U-box domain-containing protein 15-like [Capsicum annuum]|nr:putative U-box domain-containing protein 15-like [Capsicum annuum]KAF3665173.1 putative U-box domain-containing protein 15-like [Capsicum annuum]